MEFRQPPDTPPQLPEPHPNDCPWGIYINTKLIARYDKRSDAEHALRFLQKMLKTANFCLVWHSDSSP